MGKVQKIPVGRKAGQRRIELPERVEVSLAQLAGATQEGLLAFAVGVGLEVFDTLLTEDVAAIVGPKGRHDGARAAYRHGTERSQVGLGGRRVAVDKPRVRSLADEEIPLPTWSAFSGDEVLSQMALERMLAGLSARRYPAGLEPVGELPASGTSRSAVSRRFVARTDKALAQILGRDLSELSICALMADGMEIAEHTVVAAIGIDTQGNKHVLGLRQGSTENKAVCAALLSDLVERGLDHSGGILIVIDGGKGLRAAVKAVFGDQALVQRCRLHKERNVVDHLPLDVRPLVRRRMRTAWAARDPAEVLGKLKALERWLEDRWPGAAASLAEGMEETLTVTRLGVAGSLGRTLSCTNVVESAFSVARTVTRNVKRWRNGKMVLRWAGAGLEVAERQFRRVNGYRDIPKLIDALEAHVGKVSEVGGRVA